MAYHQWACENDLYECDAQPELIRRDCICDADGAITDYTDPVTDDVCWYDPQIPESAEFLGVLVQTHSAAGARDSTYTRTTVESVGEGSVLQRATLRGKGFGFTILFIGTTCRGVEYGIEWLRRTLELRGCESAQCEACNTRRLKARIFCDDNTPDNGLREWVEVGLVDGLVEIDTPSLGDSCCCMRVYQFSMTAQRPYSFTDTDDDQTITADDEESFQACYDWALGCVNCGNENCIECQNCASVLDSCELCRAKCGTCDRCGYDPVCGIQSVRPIAPVFIDSDECVVCEPLAKVVQCVEYTNLDQQVHSTFQLDLFSGYDLENDVFQERGLRNTAIRIFQNPQQLPPITDQESYDAWLLRDPCAELRFRFVPPNATVRIDGRAWTVQLLCDGLCRPFEQVVTGPSSTAIFPIDAACYDLMICVEWDAYQTQFRDDAPVASPSRLDIQRFRRWLN